MEVSPPSTSVFRSDVNFRNFRIFLLLFNGVTLPIGISLVLTSVDIYESFLGPFHELVNLRGRGYSEPPFLCLTFGGLLVFSSLFGILMFLLNTLWLQIQTLVLGIAALLLAFLSCYVGARLQHSVGVVLTYDLENSMNLYNFSENKTSLENRWDQLQIQLECCGAQNYTDWANLKNSPEADFIPNSCCRPYLGENCTEVITRENLNDTEFVAEYIYMDGCVLQGVNNFKEGSWGIYSFTIMFVLVLSCAYPIKKCASM